MTESKQDLVKIVKTFEPRLEMNASRTYLCVLGGSSMTISPQTATNVSNNQIQWTVTTPSTRTGVDRRIDVETVFYLDLNTNDNTSTLLDPVLNAPLEQGLRQYPLSSVTQVLNLRLNDQTMGWEPAEIIAPLQSYGNVFEDRQYHSASPHQPDSLYTYLVGAGNNGARNPFANYFQNIEEDSRSIQYWVRRVDNPNLPPGFGVNKRYEVRIREPLFISPLHWGQNDVQSLYGIQKIDVNFTLISSLKRMWGGRFVPFAAPIGPVPFNVTEADFSVSISQNISDHKLWLTYLTPYASEVVPSVLNYPFYQIQKFSQDYSYTVVSTPGNPAYNVQPQSVNFSNITLHEIPKRCYLFGKQQLDENNYLIPDFFPRINGLTVNFDNVDGRLSNSDAFFLWKMGAKNGLKRSWLEFSQTVGSVVCLEFGTDLTLSPALAPGVRGNFQLAFNAQTEILPGLVSEIRANVNNVWSQSGGNNFNRYRFFCVTIPEGVLNIDNQLVTVSVGGITETMLDAAPLQHGIQVAVKNLYGSGSLSNVRDVLKKVWKHSAPIIKGIAKAVADVAPHVKPNELVNEIAKQVRGSARSGGARMSSRSLSRRV